MSAPTSSSSFADWLRWLERLSPKQIELGLDRVAEVKRRLRLPSPARLLTVGGTNGKGSSVALLVQLLRRDGRTVGSYSSPHVIHYCERVCIDGSPVEEAEMVAAFSEVERARGDIRLTYFEFGTLAALCAFASRAVHSVVLEVGLGGRLDAVNAVEPDAVLITNVAMDHMDWLGDDIESIAAEKAGLMRAAKPAVFGGTFLPQSISRAASAVGAELIVLDKDYRYARAESGRWSWYGRRSSLEDLPAPALNGDHQVQNAAAVLALVEAAGEEALLEHSIVSTALRDTTLPGRQQTLTASGVEWLLDGAHNADGAAALAQTLRRRNGDQVVALALGVLADKDADAIIEVLAPEVDYWVSCTPDSARARSGMDLGQRIAKIARAPCRVVATVAESLQVLSEVTRPNDLRVVAGSFYIVGPALVALSSARPSGR